MGQNNSTNKKNKTFFTYFVNNQAKIILGVTLLAYGLSLLQYVQAHDIRAYNSDALYLPTLFKDLTEWGGHLFEWRLTPAPYFFPDMLIYFPLATLLPNWHIALTVSLLAQIILFTAGWAFLGQSFFTESKQQIAYASFVFAVVALLFMMPKAIQIIRPQHQISTHFGVVLILPYILLLVLRLIKADFAIRWLRFAWVGLVVLLGLLALSDAIAYVQIIFPLLLAIFFLGLIKKVDWQFVWTMTLTVGVTMLLVHLVRVWLIRYPPIPFSIKDVETIGTAFTQFSIIMLQYWQSGNRLFLILLLLAIGIHITVMLLSVFSAARQREIDAPFTFLSLFSLASILLIVTAVIASSLFQSRGDIRYLSPLTVLPIYSLLPLGFYLLRYLKVERFVPLLLALFIIGTQAPTITQMNMLNQYRDHYPQLLSCVDEEAAKRGLQAGVATYWDAKYISVLSKTGVKMSQISSNLSPYVWINNPAWYGRFPPQFALFNPDDSQPIDVAQLINLYGYPQEVVDCDTRELWIYNQPEHSRFQTVFADNPMATNWCPSKVSIDIPAYVWHIPTGVATPLGTALTANNVQGMMAEGQFVQQPEGQYQLNMYYEYEGNLAGDQTVADLFVGTLPLDAVDAGFDWQQYSLTAVAETKSVTFDLNGKQNGLIRLYFEGEGTLTLHQFQIEKHSETSWPQMCR